MDIAILIRLKIKSNLSLVLSIQLITSCYPGNFYPRQKIALSCCGIFPKMIKSRALAFKTQGPLQQVLQKTSYTPHLISSSVLLQILAAPVNPSDINIIQGTYPVNPIWLPEVGNVGGQEGVARVIQIGSDVTDLKIGDKVLPINQSFNTWQTHAVAASNQVLKLDSSMTEGISDVILGTSTVNPPSALLMLRNFVHLQKGDVIVQNCGTSGVGQAVIQLSKIFGYKTISIIRPRDDFQQVALNLYNLGADIVVTEDDLKSHQIIDSCEQLGPCRLGLNAVGGKSLLAMSRVLLEGSTIVTYGGMSMQPITLPTSLLIFKNLKFQGFWLNKYYRDHHESKKELLKELLGYCKQGLFKEPFHTKISWENDDVLEKVLETRQGKKILVP